MWGRKQEAHTEVALSPVQFGAFREPGWGRSRVPGSLMRCHTGVPLRLGTWAMRLFSEEALCPPGTLAQVPRRTLEGNGHE